MFRISNKSPLTRAITWSKEHLQVQITDTMTTRSLCFKGFDSLKLSDISQSYLRIFNSEVTFLFVQD